MAIQVDRILVPMDFSEHSSQALTFASNLARDFDSEVELVHVVESSPCEIYQKSGFVHSVPIYEYMKGRARQFPGRPKTTSSTICPRRPGIDS